jgi:hypothetical protein
MGRSLRVLRRNIFSYFRLGYLHTTAMETRKRSCGDAVVFMVFMFLCCFFIFGMSELEWILLDTS